VIHDVYIAIIYSDFSLFDRSDKLFASLLFELLLNLRILRSVSTHGAFPNTNKIVGTQRWRMRSSKKRERERERERVSLQFGTCRKRAEPLRLTSRAEKPSVKEKGIRSGSARCSKMQRDYARGPAIKPRLNVQSRREIVNVSRRR